MLYIVCRVEDRCNRSDRIAQVFNIKRGYNIFDGHDSTIHTIHDSHFSTRPYTVAVIELLADLLASTQSSTQTAGDLRCSGYKSKSVLAPSASGRAYTHVKQFRPSQCHTLNVL